MWRALFVLGALAQVAHADPAQTHIALPQVPSFELPAAEPGFHDVRVLRVHGKAQLDHQIKVKGYVTWIYDCVAALARPGLPAARVKQMIDKNPMLCERPRLRLGATKDAAEHQTILVVEVPRPPTAMEKKKLPKSVLKSWPAVPKVAVGDYVAISGTWALESYTGERALDGMLVYASLAKASEAAVTMQPAAALLDPPPVRRVAARATAVDAKTRATSTSFVAHGNSALAANKYDDAIEAYKEAVATWDGNHVAWWVLGVAHGHKREWASAREAWERAVKLAPDDARYQMWLGIASYEAAPEKNREQASSALRLAVELGAKQWRAHYYLGRIYRDQGRGKDAALALDRAIRAEPTEAGPYVALAEHYRRWGYLDEAIATARAGTANAKVYSPELWYELGAAHDDKRELDPAIDAYGKALAARTDFHVARFARGRLYMRKGNAASGRRDLEEFVKAAGPELDAHKQIATRLLKR